MTLIQSIPGVLFKPMRSLGSLSVSCALLFFSQGALATPPSVSPKGIFSLNGSDTISTEQFSRILSGYERQFYELTGYSPGDAPPVVVVLHEKGDAQQGPALLRMDSVEGNTPRIQIDLSSDALTLPTTATIVAQAMVLRQYYNGKSPAAGSRIAAFPAWFLHGLGKLSDPNEKTTTVPASYLRGAAPPSVADLMIQKEPDGSNSVLLEIYDAMSAELLSAGLKSDEGDQALRDWIGVFDPNTPEHPLSSWPPGWEMQSVERRWLLLMAGNSGEHSGVVELLGFEETLARYDEIFGEVTTPDHSLALLKKEKGGPYLVQQLLARLIALRLQGNPLADPLLDKSIDLCVRFRHLPEKKIAEREKTLFVLRDAVMKRSRDTEAYLDWYEAAKLPVKSELFDTFLKTPETPVQKGPIGHYLDTVEERGW